MDPSIYSSRVPGMDFDCPFNFICTEIINSLMRRYQFDDNLNQIPGLLGGCHGAVSQCHLSCGWVGWEQAGRPTVFGKGTAWRASLINLRGLFLPNKWQQIMTISFVIVYKFVVMEMAQWCQRNRWIMKGIRYHTRTYMICKRISMMNWSRRIHGYNAIYCHQI